MTNTPPQKHIYQLLTLDILLATPTKFPTILDAFNQEKINQLQVLFNQNTLEKAIIEKFQNRRNLLDLLNQLRRMGFDQYLIKRYQNYQAFYKKEIIFSIFEFSNQN
ncbi:unnamed protein product [Paramecium sonneborni]|uniref:Uncharacterized protein n=1 Tax=Paramecium sonneborni TaxID=65129 RepID=A0A8S1MJG6_9CILI|nr:unnamed protein product [Paramecium sonneborni]